MRKIFRYQTCYERTKENLIRFVYGKQFVLCVPFLDSNVLCSFILSNRRVANQNAGRLHYCSGVASPCWHIQNQVFRYRILPYCKELYICIVWTLINTETNRCACSINSQTSLFSLAIPTKCCVVFVHGDVRCHAMDCIARPTRHFRWVGHHTNNNRVPISGNTQWVITDCRHHFLFPWQNGVSSSKIRWLESSATSRRFGVFVSVLRWRYAFSLLPAIRFDAILILQTPL
jgi:hypothetical protein